MLEKQKVMNLGTSPKILIVRLSSIGDIIQCMSVVEGIKSNFPKSEIHWLVRSDMLKILQADSQIDRFIVFDRKAGFSGFLKLVMQLKQENFDLVYDAHYNLRSRILKSVITPFWKQSLRLKPYLVVRKKNRIRRFLFFTLGIKKALSIPFKSIASFQEPLKDIGFDFSQKTINKWKFNDETKLKIDTILHEKIGERQFVTLVPSAAHKMKRWPVAYFIELIQLLPQQNFIIIGGPTDDFCEEIAQSAPQRVLNLAGKTSLLESFYLVQRSSFVVSADTGFLHAADLFRKKSVALLGPTAFGHPTNKEITVLQSDLSCIPCSKDGSGKCIHKTYQQCMLDLKPILIKHEIEKVCL